MMSASVTRNDVIKITRHDSVSRFNTISHKSNSMERQQVVRMLEEEFNDAECVA